ncbi:MAG: HupE/UreJ family protein [Hyphomicrobiales bacterium]|jgi:urease accessory protein|nr:HupE/UreJ family protein [Hyphomicrobiales bacterium]
MRRLLLLVLLFTATPALAHVGADAGAHDFASGFAHPFGGLDHCLAMIAVGLVAAFLGGRARLALPGAFLGAMLAGFVAGAAKLAALPAYEAMILASVIGLGLALLVAQPVPLLPAAGLVALFGLAHGFAHGIEGALTPGYAAGFLAATAILHAIGLGLGQAVARLDRPIFYRIAGGTIAAAGLALATIG